MIPLLMMALKQMAFAGNGVVVSIVDDGIDALQADLAKNVNTAADYDYFENADFAKLPWTD